MLPNIFAQKRSVPQAAALITVICSAWAVVGRPLAHAQSGGSVRDSAGVRIVTHTSIRVAVPANLVAGAPSVDLGGVRADPREEFSATHPFAAALVRSDGAVVAVDKTELKVMDAAGKVARIVGRAGQGPGEFAHIRSACVAPGDSIIVVDYLRHSLTVFNSAGAHVRTFTPEGHFKGCFADGSLLFGSKPRVNPASVMPAAAANMLDAVQDVTRIRSDGSLVRALGSFPAEWTGVVTMNVANVVPHGDGFLVGDGNPSEVRQYDSFGKLVQIIRWNDRALPVTPDIIRREAETAGFDAAQITMLLARPAPDSLPGYMKLLSDSFGRIWVEDHYRAPQPRGWTVFARDGRLLGRTVLQNPRRSDRPAALIQFTGRWAVLGWSDDDDARHVSLHQMLPP